MLDLDTAPGRAAAESAVALAMGWSIRCTPRGNTPYAWERKRSPDAFREMIPLSEGPPAYLEGDDPALNDEMEKALRGVGSIETVFVGWGRGSGYSVAWYVRRGRLHSHSTDDCPTKAEALVRALVKARVVEVPEKSQVEGVILDERHRVR